MRRVFFMCFDAAIAAVLLIPVFALLNRYYFRNKHHSVLYIVFAVYLSAVFAVVGLPDIRYIRFEPHFNFTPFAYMFSDYMNSFLNVVLFIPLGFFLPVLWRHFKKLCWTLLFGVCTSLLIEVLQIFTLRATDINDLMTNSVGTLMGWCLGALLLKAVPSLRPGWRTQEVYVVCGAAFGVMFFLQPFLADMIFSILL